MTIDKAKKIHFIGIRGVGMTSQALVLLAMGKVVSGSDVSSSLKTPTDLILKKAGIEVYDQFDAGNINSKIDLVVTPALHGGEDNIEAKKARELGIRTASFAQMSGMLVDLCKTSISVCGTHGKTTISALLSSLMMDLNLRVTYQVGVSQFNNGRMGGGSTGLDYGVFEADEYVASIDQDPTPKMLYQHPTHCICSNIDFDHPDVFKSIVEVENAFRTFFEQIKTNNGTVIFCADDARLSKIVASTGVKSISYGVKSADYEARNISNVGGKYSFEVYLKGQKLIDCTMLIQGVHNVRNALSVVAISHQLGFDLSLVRTSISKFAPAERRLEKLFDGEITYCDDYAHHPTEIMATLSTVREIYPNRRIVMIFQPHTYSRTDSLKDEFISSFSYSDKTYLLPVYGSVRERQSEKSITSSDLVLLGKKKGIKSIFTVEYNEVIQKVMKELENNDVLLTVGAGDQVFFLREKLVQALQIRQRES